MNKKISLALISSSIMLFSTLSFADPITHPVTYICPAVSSLGNFGTHIGGTGSEVLSARTTNSVYFKSTKKIKNVPRSLVDYNNADVNYDSTKGVVSCQYKNTYSGHEKKFTVSYQITNGKGGIVQSKTANTMHILFYVGLH